MNRKFQPPIWVSCITAFFSCTIVLILLITGYGIYVLDGILYVLYVVAFISLFCTIWNIVQFIKTGIIQEKILKLIYRYKFSSRLYNDYSFRTITMAYFSFIVNVLLAIVKGAIGVWSASSWLIAFSVYYIVLCVTKLVLISTSRNIKRRKKQENRVAVEWHAYRLIGVLLLFLHAVLQGIAQLIVKKGAGFQYFGNLILVVALYDFICLISSLIYIAKNRKRHTPIIVAVKVISFITSSVSMLSLQTAMFAAFGNEMEADTRRMMNIATGQGICLIVLSISGYMIIHATKKIRESECR